MSTEWAVVPPEPTGEQLRAMCVEPRDVLVEYRAAIAARPTGPDVPKLLEPAALVTITDAMRDMLNGWKYIRETHGDLYGVGWDRAQEKMESALRLVGAIKEDGK